MNQNTSPQPGIVTIREAVQRAHRDGMPISENALRSWIKSGDIPVRMAGNRALLYYSHLVDYLCGNSVKQEESKWNK